MKPSEVAEKLGLAIKARVSAMIWGAPGVGKSALVYEVARTMGVRLQDERVSDRDPVDFRGLPRIVDGRTIWTLPDFWPTEGEGILFFDEITNAVPAVQSVCYQVVLDRKLGNVPLPDGWAVVAAGNREADRAISQRMSSALANRFVHLEFEPDLDEWVSWSARAGIRAEVVAFLSMRRDLLHAFDPSKGEKSFASPRTWEFVSRLMDAAGPNPEAAGYDLLAGAVGPGAAGEFLAFVKTFRDLPELRDIWTSPEQAKVPATSSALYAVSCAVAKGVKAPAMTAAIAYIRRLPPEFQVLACKQIARRGEGLEKCGPFIRWATDNNWITF
jgi:MoxR-like ATPase